MSALAKHGYIECRNCKVMRRPESLVKFGDTTFECWDKSVCAKMKASLAELEGKPAPKPKKDGLDVEAKTIVIGLKKAINGPPMMLDLDAPLPLGKEGKKLAKGVERTTARIEKKKARAAPKKRARR